eukprot:9363025-Pyramimonas_sp.AAC.1
MATAVEMQTLLDTANPAAFELLITTLTSTDNTIRDRSEQLYNECKKAAPLCATQLMQILRHSANMSAKSLCAVLLRKLLTKDAHAETGEPCWQALPEQTQAGLKAELLNVLQSETNRGILKKVCDTVSEIAAGIFESPENAAGWQQLM